VIAPAAGSNHWGETIEDGLRREAREETGLDVEPIALTGVYKNMTRGIIALVFRAKITGGSLATSDESTAFRWASEEEARDLASEAYAVRIADALAYRTSPAVRNHDGRRLT
jgi:8-oxo-dGTP diphosphatase